MNTLRPYFEPRAVAEAGMAHLFVVSLYSGDRSSTWEYRPSPEESPLLDIFQPKNGTYLALFSKNGVRIVDGQVQARTFLTARDLALVAYTLYVTPQSTAFLLVLLSVLRGNHAPSTAA